MYTRNNGPIRVSDADLRNFWRIAAWAMLKQRKFRYAKEARKNAKADNPPERWSTGIRIFGPPEA